MWDGAGYRDPFSLIFFSWNPATPGICRNISDLATEVMVCALVLAVIKPAHRTLPTERLQSSYRPHVGLAPIARLC